jgi:energy-coupling factor transporter ATP-binding protein EcfA2
MISRFQVQNFAVFQKLDWTQHAGINVIVGKNDTGKSHLLKLLYALVKSIEEFSRGPSPKNWIAVLQQKLTWTFQSDSLSDMISRGMDRAFAELLVNQETCSLAISKPIESNLTEILTEGTNPRKELSAVFIPPKELLTAFEAIAATRERLEIFGFDDTYYDLIKALRLPTTKGKIDEHLLRVLRSLEAMFGGEIAKGRDDGQFVFHCNGQVFQMAQTAEGIKKLGILTTLIRNRTLTKGSILFLDEPETNLHPDYIVKLMTMLMDLSRAGIQIYLATHSYFVIKQLHILAKEQKVHVPFCALTREGPTVRADFSDLLDGMPDNPIIEEAIALYEREVSLDLRR